jgi:hypothetical protein
MAEFEEKYVLFLDILGFKNLVETDQDKAVEICRNLKLNFFKKLRGEFKAIIVSDSIIVTSKDCETVIKLAAICQCLFLYHGLLSRGCINKGEIHHTDETIIVGKAYQEAVEYEQELKIPFVAIHPRLCNEISGAFFEQGSEICINYLKAIFYIDRDSDSYKQTITEKIEAELNKCKSLKKWKEIQKWKETHKYFEARKDQLRTWEKNDTFELTP